jgi:putative ABC transport system permease protein
MKSLRFALTQLSRDFKSGELTVMIAALVVAVTALTAISFFTNRVARAVEAKASEVLAADLRIEAPQPLSDNYRQQARSNNIAIAETVSFPSVILHGDLSALSGVRAVTANYPMRGRVKIAESMTAPSQEVAASPARGEVWLDGRLLAQLNANVGDKVSVGRAELVIGKVLVSRPDQGMQFVDLAPTLLMNVDDLPATNLLQPGSRASYALLFAGDQSVVADLRTYLAANKKASDRLVTVADSSEQLGSAMDRAQRFLNLAGLVSVLLSAVAVAMAARRYATRHLDWIALLKSMGASQQRVMNMQMISVTILSLLTAIIGITAGYLAQYGLAWLLADLMNGELPAPSFAPALLGLVTSVAVLAGFALPPLMQLKRVPPIRVLRKDVEPPPLRYLTLYATAIGAVMAIAWWIVRDLTLVLWLVLGMALTCAVLYASGWLLVKLLSVLRGGVGVSWRYGIANVARRGRESIAQIVAFGMGLMVLILLSVVHNDMFKEWQASLPPDAPNRFLINIPSEQANDIREFFVAQGLPAPVLSPMVRARLTSINDVPANEWKRPSTLPGQGVLQELHSSESATEQTNAEQPSDSRSSGRSQGFNRASRSQENREDRGRGFIQREANLTWSDKMPAGNVITTGEWWSEDYRGEPLLSVDQGVGQSLGLKLGDKLTYDVGGIPVTGTIANFRNVEWQSFRPNFFVVYSPGALDQSAGTLITSLHVPTEKRAIMLDFMKRYPEVTAIDIEALINQIQDVMDKVKTAMQYVFMFTLLAGVTVLFAAIQSTRDERRYESAMLRTLGASRRTVLQGVAAEFTVLGLLSGTLAASGASVVGYLLATNVFKFEYTVDPVVWIVGLIAGVLFVGVIGTLATYSVVNTPPVETLRRGS